MAGSVIDADATLIEAARRQIGSAPLGVCLDLHANVAERMVELAEITVGYRTEPHVDGEWPVITTRSHHLLLSSSPSITADPATWRHAGLEPDRADVLIVRSCSDYRASFPGSAPEAVTLDLSGPSTPRLDHLEFRHAPKPLYPHDRAAM